ncbi:hypothetical protein BO78DRAFT_397682 [Aspergillus sclerotiicarbonarius CBS 121057]|uniref:Uncharacterized protein n=1 Tax=Aspergillus sclerotiicarbonarius (strain CBS 121057 / IBT 28362) TaxID=1448318 RepID=A0A319E8T4_ASPSB|nr:hypothetical protein BO78DRAFT_397682 [Aspergillus sclerotiicarbonarius CBS 121057]
MSAPRAGRQSPPPERQTGAQQQDPPSEGKAHPQYAPPEHSAQDQTAGLSSNPKHPLEDIESAKFAKGGIA